MVNRAKTMGLDGNGKKVVVIPVLLSPPVENFQALNSLFKRIFIKPNAANGNHKRVIRTFYPY